MSELFFYLIWAHMLCDYPLQGDFLARGKNHTAPIPGIPWGHCLAAHSIIHGGAVAAVTGSLVLGLSEAVLHGVIDYGKCDRRYGYHMDQFLHLTCKFFWVQIVLWMGA